MLSAMATGAVRHRRLILSMAVALAVGCPWIGLQMRSASFIGFALIGVPTLLALASWVLCLAVATLPQPATFTVDPCTRSFRTLPNVRQIYFAIGAVLFAGSQVAMRLDPASRGATRGDPILLVMSGITVAMTGLYVLLAAGWLVAVWRSAFYVQLRPDGLIDRSPFGKLIVPWEALAPGYPMLRSPFSSSFSSLLLTYARPELVRRHGLFFGRRRISADAVDPRFLGASIAYYVAYPQCRAEIGTQEGHDRLRWALTGEPPSDQRRYGWPGSPDFA
ncbi:hypothetical protein HC031_26980 [Planosporangium thailandense]|uniref:Uncharacterized protein n=1 Tax=Planosporangium thailandense TaxID=765197 RepID=A0ABX0Y5N3_9ACTN|nr:hypothetical protein [Planosporangium thailandense]NJC73338.1 hypothetical protein [Planosporangium thailandense]